MTRLCCIIPFVCTTVLGGADGSPHYLQYGALGLCAIMVVWMCKHITCLGRKLDSKDNMIIDLCMKNTQAYNRLAELLKDRPCLNKDSRIDGKN